MVYYIKAAANVPVEGQELMQNVYNCCLEGNPADKHIFSSGSTAHIQTDIQFLPLTPLIKGDADITTLLKRMNCGKLEIQYLSKSFSSSVCCSLIRFKDDSRSEIHTILSFTFNVTHDCIEVVTFCCDGVGGGTIFNFLINAINCGIDKCISEPEYERKIILSSLPEAEGFYRKYGFDTFARENGFDVLQKSFRKRSIESVIIPINDRDGSISCQPIKKQKKGGTITKNKKQKIRNSRYTIRKNNRKSKNKMTRRYRYNLILLDKSRRWS